MGIPVERITPLLSLLSERERRVMEMYYGIGGRQHTLAEIGELYELSRQRVHQIRTKAEDKVGRLYYAEGLEVVQ